MEKIVIKSEKKICPVCMEEHDVKVIQLNEHVTFKSRKVSYDAIYTYCEKADEYYMDEQQVNENDIKMKDAYRRAEGLLSSTDIGNIRGKYGITQSDLCVLLGWGGKTITRYESHQVQDKAHDTILKKIDRDPEWFITLLREASVNLVDESYQKYMKTAMALYEAEQEQYLKKAIQAGYLSFCKDMHNHDKVEYSLDKAQEVSDFVLQRLNPENRMENILVIKETRKLLKDEFEERDNRIKDLSEEINVQKNEINSMKKIIEKLTEELKKLGVNVAAF